MICRDFENFETVGDGVNKAFRAQVTVETGALWWKKVVKRQVYRELGGYWFFADTGGYAPGLQIENLERVYKAQNTQGA